jgi:predicted GIY-YIG superfamily endonuclease
MLVSIRHQNYAYFGTTNCIRTRIQQHTCGTGATATAPAYLRPFALFAYICGFGGCRRDLRYYIEAKWKEQRDELITQGYNDPHEWALCGNSVIHNIVTQNELSGQYSVSSHDLNLICLFGHNE